MTYSQYGEDDIMKTWLRDLNRGLAVDIGAGDGMEISNTRLFREAGWDVILVEANPAHEAALRGLIPPPVGVMITEVTPGNIDEFIPPGTDLVSIDVDGDDYFLFEAMGAQPKVVCVEHNPTMPRDVDVAPARLGLRVGASVAALARVARGRGYGLVAVTECNAIFALDAHDVPIFHRKPAYAVATDYFTGRPFVIGEPPWGVDFSDPLDPKDVVVR